MWKCKSNILLALICLIRCSNGSVRIDPLVQTDVGLIRGMRASDGDYAMFMGIPYALVNADNPFGPSSPHPAFEGVFEAYDDSAICPQKDDFTHAIYGTLDCLHLNVYVPNSAHSRNQMPVLVWIHGGGFDTGYSGRYIYGPKFLVKHDVILVTVNYRLGPYGFMCLNTPEVPGNQGLKDQQLALKWIKNNIEAFGGNSNKITIYGESAGGVSVDFHSTYGDKDLFDKIIMHSGTVLAPWAVSEPDTSAPLKLAEQLGHPTTDIDDALSFLATVDTNLIIASAADQNLAFWPCIEKEFDNVDRFVDDYPINVKDLNVGSKAVLLAYNRDEVLLSMMTTIFSEDYSSLDLFADSLNENFNFNEDELNEMEAFVRHFYIGDESYTEAINDELGEFLSDHTFIYPTIRNIRRYLDSGAKDVYHFVFSYKGKRNFMSNRINITSDSVVHGDEMGYLFDVSYMDEPSSEDQVVIDRITTIWTNFVKFGNPIPESTDQLPVEWLPASVNTMNYLELDSNVNVGKRHYKERMIFWDLFYKLNEKSQAGYSEH